MFSVYMRVGFTLISSFAKFIIHKNNYNFVLTFKSINQSFHKHQFLIFISFYSKDFFYKFNFVHPLFIRSCVHHKQLVNAWWENLYYTIEIDILLCNEMRFTATPNHPPASFPSGSRQKSIIISFLQYEIIVNCNVREISHLKRNVLPLKASTHQVLIQYLHLSICGVYWDGRSVGVSGFNIFSHSSVYIEFIWECLHKYLFSLYKLSLPRKEEDQKGGKQYLGKENIEKINNIRRND